MFTPEIFVVAFEHLFVSWGIIAIAVGLTAGVVIGAVPGLTAPMGVALVLPFTFFMDPVSAILLLLGVYKGGIYGGSIPAIILNTPGTVAASATTLDGYQMTLSGQSKKALDIALISSVLADLVSTIMLILFTGYLAKLALHFGSPETFSLIFFSLLIVSSVSGDEITKGVIAALLGLLAAMVGVDSYYGTPRFIFGNVSMMNGFTILPLLVGFFAFSEVLFRLLSGKTESDLESVKRTMGKSLGTSDIKRLLPTIFRSSLFGTILGAIPGIGAAPAAFFAYSEAKRRSKSPDQFGRGALEGVAAPEAANNAVCSASFIPVLSLGIPGGTAAAVIMGAFIMQGLAPGPYLFKENKDIILAIYLGLLCGSAFLFGLGQIAIKAFVRIRLIPDWFIYPTILVLCFFSGFVVSSSFFDLKIMLFAGVVGLIFRYLVIPVAPFLIGFILGPLLENSFRESLMQSDGDLSVFFTGPICVFFWLLSAVSYALVIWRIVRKKIT